MGLSDAFSHYQQALQQLQKPEAEVYQSKQQRAINVLLARDEVQAVLNNESTVPGHLLLKIAVCDRILKQQKNLITQHSDVSNWRNIVNPPKSYWWWHLDPPALFSWLEKEYGWLNDFDWLWIFITLFALTLSSTVIIETLNRVVGEGLNTSGIFPIAVQVLLTFAGGVAALTKIGRSTLESFMARWRIPRHYWQELSMMLSVVVLVFVFGIYSEYLPHIALIRQQQGIIAHEVGKFDSALIAYKQAISLRPDFTSAHYYLGTLYEDLQKEDEAIAEYQIVVESNSDSLDKLIWLRALNNLGRLYLLQGNDRAAWIPLRRGLSNVDADLIQADSELQYEYYNLLKNMAWVRLNQKRYLEADSLLREAIKLDEERAPAHCLKAQVFDAQEQFDMELKAWKKCVQYASHNNSDEDRWIGMAYTAFERAQEAS